MAASYHANKEVFAPHAAADAGRPTEYRLDYDCETFHMLPLMSKTTIGIPNEEGCQHRRHLRLRRYDRL